MRKHITITILILFLFYYLLTFVISFAFISQSVVSNDSISLEKYINKKEFKYYLYTDIYKFGLQLINSIDKKVNLKDEDIELSGEFSKSFLNKSFSRIAKNISNDFSKPETILYFYFNSNELDIYLNKSFNFFKDYNFAKYILEKNINNDQQNNSDKNDNESKEIINENKKNVKEEVQEKKLKKNIFLRIIKKIRSTNYFFLITPIHFKIDVEHQKIPFIVILKFNGLFWQVQKIKIPYQSLVDVQNIKLGK